MKRTTTLIILWVGFFCGLFAQSHLLVEEIHTVNHSTMFGIGKVYLSDSYLSPLTYSGISMTLLHDRLRRTPHLSGRMLLQQQFQIQVGITENPTASASEYYGDISYYLTGFYPLLQTNLNASVMALYNFRWATLRWQLSTPFVGMFFSPEYGHSYYEIFTLGNNKGTVHPGSFHNQLSLRNFFTVDVPLRKVTLRAGYLGDYYQSHVNELTTKIVIHQFMLGLAFESLNFGGRSAGNREWLRSSYY